MIEGSYRSWDLYTTVQLVDGLQQKKKQKKKRKPVFIKWKWNYVVFSRATILSFHPVCNHADMFVYIKKYICTIAYAFIYVYMHISLYDFTLVNIPSVRISNKITNKQANKNMLLCILKKEHATIWKTKFN